MSVAFNAGIKDELGFYYAIEKQQNKALPLEEKNFALKPNSAKAYIVLRNVLAFADR